MRLVGSRFLIFSALMWGMLGGLQAQPVPGQPPGFTCVANADAPPILRSEGITELVVDLLLQCTGGTPTPVGAPVPLAKFQLFLNTNLTSRMIGTNGANVSEAVLVVDEPKPANQLATMPPVFPPPVGTGGVTSIYSGVVSGTGTSTVYYPNVYQARQAGPASVEWDGVPIDAPGTTGIRIYRISNVRANAAQLGVSSTTTPTQIAGFIRITGSAFPGGVPITNPSQALGSIQPGVRIATLSPDGKSSVQLNLAECISAFNPGGAAASALTPAGQLLFQENFAGSLKAKAGNSAETGSFYNPNIREINTEAPAGTAGLADFGTRLRAVFNNVPAGAKIFVSIAQGPGSSTGTSVQLEDSNTGAPIAALPNGYAQLATSSTGSASAIWEVTAADHSSGQPLQVILPYTFSWSGCQGTTDTCPTGTNTFVNFSYAPPPSVSGTAGADPSLSIPRFMQPAVTATANNGLAGAAINRCFGFKPSFSVTGVAPNGQIGGTVNSLTFPYVSGSNVPGGFYITNLTVGTDTGTPGAETTGINTSVAVQNLPSSNGREGNSESNFNPAATATTWLSATPTSNVTPLSVILKVDPRGLAVGTYNAQVSLTGSGVTVSPFSIPVTLNVQPSRPILKLAGVQHAATYVPGSVAPGEVAVFFGELFGPDTIAVASANVDTFPTAVGNTQVLFDGNPAPMIYALKNQVSAMVPFGLAGKTSTQVQIVYNGVKSDAVTVPVVAALPGLFSLDSSGGGQGAILNQDGTLNSFANPAPAGTIVVLFGTGAGQTNPPGQDGKLALSTFPAPLLQPVTVSFDGVQGDVLYGAQAPTLIQGVLQVNVRIPATVKPNPGVPIVVKVGTQQSPAWAMVAVGPAQQ